MLSNYFTIFAQYERYYYTKGIGPCDGAGTLPAGCNFCRGAESPQV